jgi:hypothetical protein
MILLASIRLWWRALVHPSKADRDVADELQFHTSAMFNVIYSTLLNPFPYADADRIVNPSLIDEKQPLVPTWFALEPNQYESFMKAKSIESVLGFMLGAQPETGGDFPEDVRTAFVTPNMNDFLDAPALLGRGLKLSDGSQNVIVLSYKYWQRRFGGDRSVIRPYSHPQRSEPDHYRRDAPAFYLYRDRGQRRRLHSVERRKEPRALSLDQAQTRRHSRNGRCRVPVLSQPVQTGNADALPKEFSCGRATDRSTLYSSDRADACAVVRLRHPSTSYRLCQLLGASTGAWKGATT